MLAPEALRRLCAVLAQLYPDKVSATRIVDDVGVPTRAVAWNERAIDNWHAILKEVEKHNRLALLLEIVNEEYGANPDLRAVSQLLAEQQVTPPQRAPAVLDVARHRLGFGLFLFGMLVMIGVWTYGQSISQWWQATATPAPTIIIATQAATPQPTAASFTYGVTVKDASTDQPIAQAKVLIEVTGKAPLDEFTDNNGYARIFIDAALVDSPGRLTISADGYAVARQNIDLWPDRLPDEFRLTRQ